MQAPPLKRLSVYGAIVLVVALCIIAYLALRPGSVKEGGPLSMGINGSGVGVPTDIGQAITYGEVIFSNEGTAPFSLVKAELLSKETGAVVDAVRVLDTSAVAPGTLIGTGNGFNPPTQATEVPNTVIQPAGSAKKRYQLIFSVRQTAEGSTVFDGVRITYKFSGRTYARTGDFKLRVCAPKTVDCPAPSQNGS